MFETGSVHAHKDPAHRFRRFGQGAFYKILADHWQDFLDAYDERFERICGKLRFVVQIPDRHEKTTIYYGIYSNASKLREGPAKLTNDAQQAAADEVAPQHDFKSKKKTRLGWAQLMERTWKPVPP